MSGSRATIGRAAPSTGMCKYLISRDLAERLGVTPAFISQLVAAGKIVPSAITSRGTPLFSAATVEELAVRRAMNLAGRIPGTSKMDEGIANAAE